LSLNDPFYGIFIEGTQFAFDDLRFYSALDYLSTINCTWSINKYAFHWFWGQSFRVKRSNVGGRGFSEVFWGLHNEVR